MKRVAVLGLGLFGRTLALALAEAGVEVIAIDRAVTELDEVKDRVSVALQLDTTDEEALRGHGLREADAAVVAIGNDFEATVLTVAILRGLGVPRIIARSTGSTQGRILSLVGAEEVIAPEEDAARRLAQRILGPQFIRWIDLGDGAGFAEVAVPDFMIGRSLGDVELRRKYHLNLVGIRRRDPKGPEDADPRTSFVTTPEFVFEKGDVLLLVGEPKGFARLARR